MRQLDVASAAAPTPEPTPRLGPGAQLARDARARVVAAASVVLVHSAYRPGDAVLEGLPPGPRLAAAIAFTWVVAFPVNTFVMLSFLGLTARLDAGLGAARLVRLSARRLLPAHLVWSGAFLLARAAAQRRLPSPAAVVEAVVLGKAAAHLYFVPALLCLTAAAPALGWLAATPRRAVAGGAGLAAASLAAFVAPGGGPWREAAAGVLGLAPFAVAGLALGRAWGGLAPGPRTARAVLGAAVPLALASAAGLAWAAAGAGGGPIPLAPLPWVANVGLALAAPLLLLAAGGAVPPWVLRAAPFTLGVYLLHPFWIQALRALERRAPDLAAAPVLLAVPNAVAAALLSLATVALLARTPLRRAVI